MFELPTYNHPNFEEEKLKNAPDAALAAVEQNGVAPDYFHSTSMFPEYCKMEGAWHLAIESRMDCCMVWRPAQKRIDTVEPRLLQKGDLVVLGRSEDGREGIYLHTGAFLDKAEQNDDQFAFRSNRSRETAHTGDYDKLFALLNYERRHGNILWVLGPAFTFDHSARAAMQSLIERGYAHGLMAGNALATHDIEGAFFGTGLGQGIYDHRSVPNGHYHHLDAINRVRRSGSIAKAMEDYKIDNGIMYAAVKKGVPFVLTSSIRDDGPLPEVIADTYEGQAAMRDLVRQATTVICLATQLHTIATGNMTPSFREMDGVIRPLYFFSVDISEFPLNKLHDRGSLSAVTFCTNVQDFIGRVSRGVEP